MVRATLPIDGICAKSKDPWIIHESFCVCKQLLIGPLVLGGALS